jgi:hypothetical protein
MHISLPCRVCKQTYSEERLIDENASFKAIQGQTRGR